MVCGIDEAGRGPLAGPVCAAAVILPSDFPFYVLGDSKQLSPASREIARILVSASAVWGIGWASPSEIDEINIHNATLLAMKRAFEAMIARPDFAAISGAKDNVEVIVDGLFTPAISAQCRALVKADSQVYEVMAASILAKTARDRLMEYYSIFYPEYGYEKHKGCPTPAHRAAIMRFGPSPIQRKTFRVS